MTDIVIFFDGSCYPNPGGSMGIGVAVYEAKNFQVSGANTRNPKTNYSSIKILEKISFREKKSKKNTNNVAEHTALNTALNYLIEREVSSTKIFIFGDSEMTIKQMCGDYKLTPGKNYYPIASENISLAHHLLSENRVKFIWIPRELNSVADSLSKI